MNLFNIILSLFTKVKSNEVEIFRMLQWLLISFCLYAFAIALANKGIDFYPQIQTVSWKLGHLTIAAFFGYWIDRNAFRDRITPDSIPLITIRRAIIIMGSMIAISLGM